MQEKKEAIREGMNDAGTREVITEYIYGNYGTKEREILIKAMGNDDTSTW